MPHPHARGIQDGYGGWGKGGDGVPDIHLRVLPVDSPRHESFVVVGELRDQLHKEAARVLLRPPTPIRNPKTRESREFSIYAMRARCFLGEFWGVSVRTCSIRPQDVPPNSSICDRSCSVVEVISVLRDGRHERTCCISVVLRVLVRYGIPSRDDIFA